MRREGILFTLAAVMVGVIVFAFSVAYNETAKTYVADKRIIELERATGQCANAEYNVQKTFKKYAGYNISQDAASLLVTGSLPYNGTIFQREINRIRNFTEGRLANTTVTAAGTPHTMASNDINVTYVGEHTLRVELPYAATNITFRAYTDTYVNDSQCQEERATIAGDIVDAEIKGPSGLCDMQYTTNLSDYTNLTTNWDGGAYMLEFTVIDRVIKVTNEYDTPLRYNLTVWTNESRYVLPARVDASVGSNIGSAGCVRGVRLA